MNLDFSFWRYVDISGLDLTSWSMRDVDLIDYTATGTTFPECPYSQFRFPVDNAGVVLPANVSSFNHDLVVEAFRQATNARDPIIQKIIAYVGGAYDRSWHDTLFMSQQTDSAADVFAAMSLALTGYPRLLARLDKHFATDDWGPEMTTDRLHLAYSAVLLPLEGRDPTLDLRSEVPSGQFDRWAYARRLENYIKANTDATRVAVYVTQLHPDPIIHVEGDNVAPDYDWQRERAF